MADWQKLGSLASFMRTDGLEFREYQYNIIRSALTRGNTLVVLPTGLGKTVIGAAVIADALAKGKRALFLAPTKPLAEQHRSSLLSLMNIDGESMTLLLGSVKKSKRKEAEKYARVIIATPQTIANDLKSGEFSLEGFGVAVFDECHRAVGKYAYTYVANECKAIGVQMLGLTASPGGKRERINALIETLGIVHIEARTSEDDDVAKYVMQKNLHIITVEKTERIMQIAGFIAPEADAALANLNKMGIAFFKKFDKIPRGRLIQLGNEIGKLEAKNYRFAAIASYVKLLHLSHAYDLLLTEGIYPFSAYMDSLEGKEKKSKAVESILGNKRVVLARKMAKEALERGEEHQKIIAVVDIIKDYRGRRAIIFAQYRSTIRMINEYLQNNGFKTAAFVGKKDGVTQEAQKEVISRFRKGEFDVLVASSIGEEGLDIPDVDAVIFYEPIPSEIRNIQRRGRTGRFRAGEVYILVTKDTKDQVYLYISGQRERKMVALIRSINSKLDRRLAEPKQMVLGE